MSHQKNFAFIIWPMFFRNFGWFSSEKLLFASKDTTLVKTYTLLHIYSWYEFLLKWNEWKGWMVIYLTSSRSSSFVDRGIHHFDISHSWIENKTTFFDPPNSFIFSHQISFHVSLSCLTMVKKQKEMCKLQQEVICV